MEPNTNERKTCTPQQSSSAPRFLQQTQRCASKAPGAEAPNRAPEHAALLLVSRKGDFLSSLRKNRTHWDQTTQQHKQRAPFQHNHHQNLAPTRPLSPRGLEPRARTALHGALAAFPGRILGWPEPDSLPKPLSRAGSGDPQAGQAPL